MALLPFEPETGIERRILDAQAGKFPADTLILELAESALCVPSQGEVQDHWRGFVPVLLEQNGLSFVAVFTAPSRQPQGFAEFSVTVTGKHFFLRLPAGYGVIVNPGYDAQLLLPPDGVALLKQDLHKP